MYNNNRIVKGEIADHAGWRYSYTIIIKGELADHAGQRYSYMCAELLLNKVTRELTTRPGHAK
jgi:hypothetical protein